MYIRDKGKGGWVGVWLTGVFVRKEQIPDGHQFAFETSSSMPKGQKLKLFSSSSSSSPNPPPLAFVSNARRSMLPLTSFTQFTLCYS
ncbi:hypothetical protein M0804_012174 [Polistes exclamans]|nr:hypothetical protein M0804_012174 [Polistes exclamans]